MKNNWIDIKETGQLYLEQILVAFEIPILFVCIDLSGRRYLCECADEESGQFVITSIDNTMLLQMLLNEVAMEYVFRNASPKLIITEYDFQNSKMKSREELAQNIPAEYLPEHGAFMEMESKEILKYIDLLKSQVNAITFGNNCEIDSYVTRDNFNFFEHIKTDDFITTKRIKSMILETKNEYFIFENNDSARAA